MQTSDLVTLKEVAEILGITYGYAKVKRHRGQLPEPVVIAGRPVWSRETIEKLRDTDRA